MDQDARRRRAGLARILHPGAHQERQRGVEIGVREHDLRRLATELQRHRHRVRRRRRLHRRSGRDRPGEAQVMHPRMRRERRARLRPGPRHHVERAGRQARRLGQPRDGQRGQARLLGGLEHAGIAGRQRRPDRPADDLHRIVPGHDMAGHAMRLAQGEDRVSLLERDRLAVQLVGRAAIELAIPRQGPDIGPRLAQRLAHVARLQHREILGPLRHQPAQPGEDPPPLGRRHPSPGPGHRRVRGGNGGVDLPRAAPRDPRQRPRRRRVLQHQRLRPAEPAPADEHLLRIEPERPAQIVHRIPSPDRPGPRMARPGRRVTPWGRTGR